MRHTEYIREVDGARAAVLFVHGIVGTPAQFEDLVPCVPDTVSVYNILLEGHGSTVDDFAAASMQAWHAQVDGWIARLEQRYDRIVIVAHSMGTLLALRAAARGHEKIKGLFLLAVPLIIRVLPRAVITSLKVIFGRVEPDDIEAVSASRAYSIQPDWRLWKYIRWLKPYAQLLAQSRAVRRQLPQVTVPCVVFQSRRDELVSRRAVRYLETHLNGEIAELPHSSHHWYDKSDNERLILRFRQFVDTALS